MKNIQNELLLTDLLSPNITFAEAELGPKIFPRQ